MPPFKDELRHLHDVLVVSRVREDCAGARNRTRYHISVLEVFFHLLREALGLVRPSKASNHKSSSPLRSFWRSLPKMFMRARRAHGWPPHRETSSCGARMRSSPTVPSGFSVNCWLSKAPVPSVNVRLTSQPHWDSSLLED